MSIKRIDVSVKFTDAASQQAFEDAVQASELTFGQYLAGLLNCELPSVKVNEGFDIANPLASLGLTSTHTSN
jgi:hypothetical protein